MIDLILLTLQDISGSGKFKKRPLQNEEDMRTWNLHENYVNEHYIFSTAANTVTKYCSGLL